MFYDVALIDKYSGKMIATWAGVTKDLASALYNVLQRAEGKIEHNERLALRDHVTGALYPNNELPEAQKHYGYVVRSMSEVKNF